MRQQLSVLIPTFNEEYHIKDCLQGVKWADEIFIVDSFSTDNTLAIAKEFAHRIVQHEYINSATQKNWAIPQVKHEWVLIVDSDERVTGPLRTEIEEVLGRHNDLAGYYIPRLNHFLGKEIRYGGWGPENDLNIRLFRKDKGRYEEKEVHADVQIDGAIGRLRCPLRHYPYENIGHYLKKAERYTDWASLDLCDSNKKVGWFQLLLRPPATFLKMYIWQRGFMDGTHGLALALLSAYYNFLKYVKAWERNQRNQRMC